MASCGNQPLVDADDPLPFENCGAGRELKQAMSNQELQIAGSQIMLLTTCFPQFARILTWMRDRFNNNKKKGESYPSGARPEHDGRGRGEPDGKET